MIDLRHLRHLIAVATHPTLQAAADDLHLTQPALTRSIARFEESLGAPLFDRRGRRLALTELGERLVTRGEDLLRRVRDLEEEIRLWQGLGTGSVSVGVAPEAELGLLPRVLEDFVSAHPGVELTVRSGTTEALLPALLEGELHFLVADAERVLGREDLEVRPLAPDPIAVALRPDHPLADRSTPELAELARFPLAGASTAPRFDRWRAEIGLREQGRPFSPALLCDNYEVLVRVAQTSDVLVFGPGRLLEAYAQAGRLKVMPWPLEGPDTQLCLIRSRQRTLSPAAARLWSCFAEEGTLSAPERTAAAAPDPREDP
jgi:DNA-binding transcriptional LysR family regulator